jgi:hypothetical protein
MALAQEGGLNLLCVTGFGCGFSPLDEESAALAFPEHNVYAFADLFHGPPRSGDYHLSYPGAALICQGVPVDSQPSDSEGRFEALDEDGAQIMAYGMTGPGTELLLERYSPGFYAGGQSLEEGDFSARFSVFLMVADAQHLSGLVMGEIESADGPCSFWTHYEAAMASTLET